MAGSTKKITKVTLEHMDWEQVDVNLRETQDLWWLNEIYVEGKKITQLDNALEKGRSFKKEELLAPNKWLTPENYQKYVKRVVDIIKKFKDKNMTLDGDTDQAFEELKEELQQINESNVNLDGHRKPHTAYIANRVKLGKKRGESWEKFKQLANDSIGKQQVELPGYGKIYLRRVRINPEQEILYSHESFDHDETENLPAGVLLIRKTAYDTAWNDIANKGNIKET
tara:strand:+ start:79 stop:756 length:678 start_codon:yes stop_codon:yes gene_type:complete